MVRPLLIQMIQGDLSRLHITCFACSKNFADTLRRFGGKAESILYDGKTHTDLFLQVMEDVPMLCELDIPVRFL